MTHITAHSVDRYIQRVEPCTRREARDRLAHAIQISERPSSAFIHAVTTRECGKDIPTMRSATFRYCPVESLLLTFLGNNLVTVMRVESPEQLTAKRRKRRVA